MWKLDDFDRMKRVIRDHFGHQGLPARTATKCTQIWMCPSLSPWVSWSLFQDGQFYVRRITWSPADRSQVGSPDTYAAEGIVPVQIAESILDSLALLNLQPFVEQDSVVLDGVTYGVSSGSAGLSSQVEFTLPLPKHLEPAAQWIASSVSALESCLPSSTIELDHVAF